MKKGDIVGRNIEIIKGEILALGFETKVRAEDWIRKTNATGEAKLRQDGGWDVVASNTHQTQQQAKVMWVVEHEASLEIEPGAYSIVNWKEEGWFVLIEATPSYQSSVAEMSDEQLRESIETLRNTKVTQSKTRTSKPKKEAVDKNDPLALALAGLSELEKEKLKRKLGLI